jgi:membrane-bound lytic murein transglycosylase MltF
VIANISSPIYSLLFTLLTLLTLTAPAGAGDNGRPASDSTLSEEAVAVLYRPVETKTTDLNRDTRTIRILVHYGRTEFFVANGRPFGVEYELFSEYEKYLNKNRDKHSPKITLSFIPVRFDELIPFLLEGKGDVAAGLLTVTEKRKEQAAFTQAYLRNVNEVLVAYSGAAKPKTLQDLAGKTVHLLRGSSFVHHLDVLNRSFSASGLPPIEALEMPASANVDDILEMVNAGIFQYTFADNFVADLWSHVLPNVRVIGKVILHRGGDIAWAVRPDNPGLLKSLNDFLEYEKHRLQPHIDQVWKKYFVDTRLISNPLDMESFGRVKLVSPHFREAAAKNKLDWLMMMAQGYQESELDQGVRSPRGAIGIMQLLPGTAKSVGYGDISSARSNISAGVTYLGFIRRTYFNETEISPEARVDFALAAYNAGPNRIQGFRLEARKRGLNPNVWFNNVERVALDKIGEETVRYVANVNKYYIAYRMSHYLDEHKLDLSSPGPGGK